ncbi:MAG TPA: MmgE/PrpD family protein [Steroidobacteraceae bacterium]
MSALSVTERLVAFAREWATRGVPDDVLHEANRLLINQLKASVGAVDHEAVRILHDWSTRNGAGNDAHVLWLGTGTSKAEAAAVNAALCEVLDFNDTYIPCFMHAVSGVLPAVLAVAETTERSGRDVLSALALGIESELACASILMPTGYYRGFIPGGLTGAIGGAVACSLLDGLDETQMRNAIGLAMNTGMGVYQSAGYMALPYVMAMAARNGVVAYELAKLGMDAPRTVFEGDKGMLSSYSDEPAEKIETVLAELGQGRWRIHGQTYKVVPTETITHAPIELIFQLRQRARGRTVRRMVFGVAAVVVKIADERRERFGVPNSELTAKFDLRHCAAAAWIREKFTLDEMKEGAYTDPRILDLRSRIELVADRSFETFNGATLTVEFTDGSVETARIDNFRGTPGNPLSDEELSRLFLTFSDGFITRARAERILEEAWGLERSASIHPLMQLLTERAS